MSPFRSQHTSIQSNEAILGRLSAVLVAAVVLGATAAGAGTGTFFRGGGGSDAGMSCPGGMTRLGHVFDENASVFPGDPPPDIDIIFNVADDGFLVENVNTGTHTSTHLDAPVHFIEGATSVDQLPARDFVWPAYVIDVRDRVAVDPDFQLSPSDIRDYERSVGRIPRGAMVIIQTGFGEVFGTPAYLDSAPGFSGAGVQWLFDRRDVGGVGSDTFGPDASSDGDFLATFTTLANGGVVLTNLANLDSLHRNGDLVMAPTVALRDGSGYQVDPISCRRSDDDGDSDSDSDSDSD